MSKNTLVVLALFILGVFAGRSACPRIVERGRVIPQIITKYDTVRTKWVVHDTVLKVTTDTFNLVETQTLYDTVVINVKDTSTNLWPIVLYEQRADTAWLRTFELSTGRGTILRVHAPGPVLGIYADSVARPRLSYGEWPRNETSLFKKILYIGSGYAACTLSSYVSR